MNNEARDSLGKCIGFICWECNKVYLFGWGEKCNECTEKERRHKELCAAIKASPER